MEAPGGACEVCCEFDMVFFVGQELMDADPHKLYRLLATRYASKSEPLFTLRTPSPEYYPLACAHRSADSSLAPRWKVKRHIEEGLSQRRPGISQQ